MAQLPSGEMGFLTVVSLRGSYVDLPLCTANIALSFIMAGARRSVDDTRLSPTTLQL